MLFLLQWTHSMRRITILKFWILTFFACHSFLSKLAFLRLLERFCKIMWNHKHPNRNEWCNKKLLSHFHNNCFWFCCVTYLIFLFLLNKNAFNVFLNTVFTRLLAAPYKAFFHHFVRLTIKGSLQSRTAYIFFFSLSKCLDDAQSFLGYVLLTKPSLRIIFPLFSIMCTSITGGIMMNRRQL